MCHWHTMNCEYLKCISWSILIFPHPWNDYQNQYNEPSPFQRSHQGTPSSPSAPSGPWEHLPAASMPGSLHFLVSVALGYWVQIIIPPLFALDWGVSVCCHHRSFLGKTGELVPLNHGSPCPPHGSGSFECCHCRDQGPWTNVAGSHKTHHTGNELKPSSLHDRLKTSPVCTAHKQQMHEIKWPKSQDGLKRTFPLVLVLSHCANLEISYFW